MKVIRDGILLCEDCTTAAVNGDLSGVDSRAFSIRAGLKRLGRSLVPDFEGQRGFTNFSNLRCACCLTSDAGARYCFAKLGTNK